LHSIWVGQSKVQLALIAKLMLAICLLNFNTLINFRASVSTMINKFL
jgi:hypothetical protein